MSAEQPAGGLRVPCGSGPTTVRAFSIAMTDQPCLCELPGLVYTAPNPQGEVAEWLKALAC